jgi:hypothetical protein
LLCGLQIIPFGGLGARTGGMAVTFASLRGLLPLAS